ncbi:hypothetical protein D3C81_199730 [compost metagenome]
MADEKEVVEGVAEAAVPEAGNTAERLFALEQKIGLLQERVKFLEEHNAQVQLNVREEAMRLLGMTFATMGENLLTSAAARYKYTVCQVGEQHPINDQTFYATREGAKWAYHILEKGEIKPFEVSGMVEPMRKAVLEFMMTLPPELASVAFNAYRA